MWMEEQKWKDFSVEENTKQIAMADMKWWNWNHAVLTFKSINAIKVDCFSHLKKWKKKQSNSPSSNKSRNRLV